MKSDASYEKTSAESESDKVEQVSKLDELDTKESNPDGEEVPLYHKSNGYLGPWSTRSRNWIKGIPKVIGDEDAQTDKQR